MVKALREIRDRRRTQDFVGREEQLTFFQNNLSWDLEDVRRRFVISVAGQGGVGKTWLLRRFGEIARESGALTAYTDESEESVPEAMARISEQHSTEGHSFEAFTKRYQVYREKCREIESDPDIVTAFPARIGRAVTKGTLDVVRQVPGAGAVAQLLPDEYIVDKGGEFAAAVARKLKKPQDVELILEPAKVLTPLLVDGLREAAEERLVVLIFDTYERTSGFLDSWLRALMEDDYGEIPANILVIVAGRHELDRNAWAACEGLIARLPLEPFTEQEAREYLGRKGVTEERVVDVILSLTGRLPLLVAMLATESPDDPDKVGDASGEAVRRFLWWVEDQNQRQLALDASLARWLNLDVVAALVGPDEAGHLFSWLQGMPFVQKGGKGWFYHEVVRQQMIRYKHQESQIGWRRTQETLGRFHEEQRDALGIEVEDGRKNEAWKGHELEALYHRLCWAPEKQLPLALNGFLAALRAGRALARDWARAMEAAGTDAGSAQLEEWGQRLRAGLSAYEEKRYAEVVQSFSSVLERDDLEAGSRAVALDWRGYVRFLDDQYSAALEDFTEAIGLAPEEAEYWADRARTFWMMSSWDEALADFDRAIELDPEYEFAFYGRGIVNRFLHRYQESLFDLDRAIELDPESAWTFTHRAMTLQLMKRYEKALADLDRAIELDPEHTTATGNRGFINRDLERYKEALADFGRTIDLDPEDAWSWASRGETYWLMERYEDALADLDRAIELDPQYSWSIQTRGDVYRELKRYDDALADYDRVVELLPNYAVTIASRGQTYRRMERYEEALADFDRAIELDPEYTWAIVRRGETQADLKCYKEALADFDRALELEPGNTWTLVFRGGTYLFMERFEEALADLNRVIELDSGMDVAIAGRGETYRRMERYEEALADFDRAIELDPEFSWAIAARGRLHANRGNKRGAMEDYARAIELDSEDDEVWYSLACLQALLGGAAEACRWLAKAIDLDGDYRVKAREDEDFDCIRQEACFVALAGYDEEAEGG